jgi:hypothetical protein
LRNPSAKVTQNTTNMGEATEPEWSREMMLI